MTQLVSQHSQPTISAAQRRPASTSRRAVLAGLAVAPLSGVSMQVHAQSTGVMVTGSSEWNTFRERFVTGDGRVVDTGNRNMSHSEGQGIGMLGAAQFGDRAAFNRLHRWTRETLRRPSDHLHSWRYLPDAKIPVDDLNNATDGDLLIAFALATAADRWGVETYRQEARTIAADILHGVTTQTSAGLVLLPGAAGFTNDAQVVVNPSYYIFPALRRLSEELPTPAWHQLWASGLHLLQQARFGRWSLPPDWLALPRSVSRLEPAGAWPARFSFDAVRIPLYLTWAGLGTEPVVTSVMNFWGDHQRDTVPAWVDLHADRVAPYAQPSGMVAVTRYVAAMRNNTLPRLPTVASAPDYYAGALTLLTQIALEPPLPVV